MESQSNERADWFDVFVVVCIIIGAILFRWGVWDLF